MIVICRIRPLTLSTRRAPGTPAAGEQAQEKLMWRRLVVVARIARIPEKSLSRRDRDTLKNLGDLKMVVFG
ncbi:hypothetical protein ACLK19_06090 [Escherichia coli]